MRKWITEDWRFTITVVEAGGCRLGLEKGDRFTCTYGCPEGFCPKTMAVLHSLCEAARAGGDYMLLGGAAPHEIAFPCADGPVRFLLQAQRIPSE